MTDELVVTPGTEVLDGTFSATVTISCRGFNEKRWIGKDVFATEAEAMARAAREAARILAEPEKAKQHLLHQFALAITEQRETPCGERTTVTRHTVSLRARALLWSSS
jgi:hypothetical protein